MLDAALKAPLLRIKGAAPLYAVTPTSSKMYAPRMKLKTLKYGEKAGSWLVTLYAAAENSAKAGPMSIAGQATD